MTNEKITGWWQLEGVQLFNAWWGFLPTLLMEHMFGQFYLCFYTFLRGVQV